MRLYAKSLQDQRDLQVDLLAVNPHQVRLPDLGKLEHQLALLQCTEVEVLANGHPQHWSLELELSTGSLRFNSQHETFAVFACKDADRLRLELYEQVLETWYHSLQHEDVSRHGLDLLDQVRQHIFRLRDSLEQPETLQYQFL